MSLTGIVDELAAALDDVLGTAELGEDAAQIVPRLNLSPTGVSIDIFPADPFRTEEAAGFGEISGAHVFTVRARVEGDVDGVQERLLQMMDDEHDLCVAAALASDQTLNGLASSVDVDGPTGFRVYADNPGAMLGVEWTVSIIRAVS